MQKPIIIINGPNLNLLGKREVEIYGDQSFESYFQELLIRYPNLDLRYFQSNHEGVIIDLLQEHGYSSKGIILNAAGYTHTSIAIADTIIAIESPVVEVHISDINAREDFRKQSFLKAVCVTSIVGVGLVGYEDAIDFVNSNY